MAFAVYGSNRYLCGVMKHPVVLPRKQKVVVFMTHLLFISVLFVLPEVLMSISRRPDSPIHWQMYVKSFVYVGVFYVNYYLIIDRTLIRNRSLWRFLVYNVALVTVTVIALYVVWRLWTQTGWTPPRRRVLSPGAHDFSLARALSFLIRDFMMMVLTIGISVALKLTANWGAIERDRERLMTLRREEELQNLKSQLNPHFLFNTLNTIYALIAVSPDKAQQAVHELSRLLRYVLYENPATVTLSQELAFIDNYIRLMKLRIGGRVRLDVRLDAGDCGEMAIAPLIFITLVENVFKHGNTGTDDAVIGISITACDGVVCCRTCNRVGDAVTCNLEKRSGIGVANLRRRLELLYGDKARLESCEADGMYNVELTIDLK